MTAVVRIEALRALAALIELEIPQLAGHVCAGQAPSSEDEELPNLSIQPGKWTFLPEQAREHAVLPGNVVVYEVGNHEAPCVLSIVAPTTGERWALEALVLDLFHRATHPLTGMRLPGVLAIQVSALPELSRWACSFELEEDEWIDTAAFDRRYESRIHLTATIPTLTIDRPVYTIDQLVLSVAQIPSPAATSPTAPPELVTINPDGTLQPFTP